MPKAATVQERKDQHQGKLFIFTDGSKDPEPGRTGTAVYIPQYDITIKNNGSYLRIHSGITRNNVFH